MLQKLRRAMIRPERDRLSGPVEVDETDVGGGEEGRGGGRKRDSSKAIDWMRVDRIVPGAEPARLPPEAAPPVLNLIATLAAAQGVAALRYTLREQLAFALCLPEDGHDVLGKQLHRAQHLAVLQAADLEPEHPVVDAGTAHVEAQLFDDPLR